jgi:S1-C subfamily serine protease
MERHHDPLYPAGRVQVQMLLTLLLLAVVGWLLLDDATTWFADLHYEQAQSRPVAARGELASDETSTIELFRSVGPSVVYITSMTVRQDCFYCRVLEIPQGTGTGFVWDENGYIVTNYHVIADTQTTQVALMDHSTWKAKLVGADPDKDIAVLKIDAPKELLPPIPMGTSRGLQVGQKVFAIGNPFGFDQTLTSGIISGLGREIVGAADACRQMGLEQGARHGVAAFAVEIGDERLVTIAGITAHRFSHNVALVLFASSRRSTVSP